MNTLLIDCSNGLKLGIITPNKKQFFIDEESKKQSHSLLIKIDEMLKDNNLNIKDIQVIAVCVGPGSFTGIRVALSTAKGLVLGCNANIVTFTSFDCINKSDRNIGKIVEGFGNNYYYRFKKFGKVFEGCSEFSKLKILAEGTKIYTNSMVVKNQLAQCNIVFAEYDPTSVIENKILNKEFTESNKIAPLYLRASQAELERLKNGN